MREKGVPITRDSLKISDRAVMVLPIHPLQDKWEEARLGKDHFGSTLRGISPVYGDKYMKKALRMGDLLHPEHLKKQLKRLLDWKNQVIVPGYGAEKIDFDETLKWIEEYGAPLMQHVCDAGELLENAVNAGKSVLFEAQLGALRDIDYGIYPFTSSSSPLAAYAPVGCGLPSLKVDLVVGVTKAYSTCVGEGPFVGELDGEEADKLREAGAEYGAATGRPRRVAWMDLVATRYGTALQGATELALTKLDVLSYLDKIPVCVAYEKNGRRVDRFPYTPGPGRLQARVRGAARLADGHRHLPRIRAPALRGARLCGVHRKERRLPHQVRLRGRGARQPHHPLRGNEHARCLKRRSTAATPAARCSKFSPPTASSPLGASSGWRWPRARWRWACR